MRNGLQLTVSETLPVLVTRAASFVYGQGIAESQPFSFTLTEAAAAAGLDGG